MTSISLHPSRRTIILGGSLLLAATALGRANATALTKSTGAVPAFITNYCPPLVALEKGYFKDEGYDTAILSSGGGSHLREMVAAGQVDFGLGDITHPMQMTNRGRAAKALFAVDDRATYINIVVRPDWFDQGVTDPGAFANAAKLRPDGSKPVIAVSTLGGGTHVYAYRLFDRLGLANQIDWVAGGITKTMLGGLETKQFDAIVAAPSWQFEAISRGIGKVIFDVADAKSWDAAFGGRVPATVGYALQSTIDNNPAVVQAYVNAVYRALQYIKSTPVADLYALLSEKYFEGVDKQSAQQELAYYQSLFNYDGSVDAAEYENGAPIWFNDMTEIKPIAFSDAFDLRFIEAAIAKYGT